MDLFGETQPIKKTQSFHTNTDNNEVWLTPPEIIHSLGEFDLDPCSPTVRPWPTAKHHLTIHDESLLHEWFGRVWLNPPYGKYLPKFMEKMAMHGNGVALIFARTETQAFQRFVFPHAESILFMQGRINFHLPNGDRSKDRANAPSVLIGYTEFDSDMIDQSGIKGHHIALRQRVFIAGISCDANKTWRVVVGEALEELGREAALADIYDAVMRLAPNKTKQNQHFKAKVRQVVQLNFERISAGKYKLN